MDPGHGTEISWATSPPAELRDHHLADALLQEGPAAADVSEIALDAEGLFRGGLLFQPRAPRQGTVIVYFHGGGFLAGSPRTHRCVASWLAHFSRMPVLSVRYRLTPEHRYPAQRDDAVAACAKAAALFGGADGLRLMLAGDSAGACVSLWGLLGLPMTLRAEVAGLVLFYGGYGLTESASIARAGNSANGLDSEALVSMYSRLLDGETYCKIEDISPLVLAAGVRAPTYILAAEDDALYDDSVRLHQRLAQQGTPTIFVSVPDVGHGYLKESGRSHTANQTLKAAAIWMVEAVNA